MGERRGYRYGLSGIYNERKLPWDELDTVLLAIEDLFDSYPEDREVLVEETELLSIAQLYLWEYIEAGEYAPSTLSQNARDELLNFVNNHGDSRYWEIVNTAVETYESSDWKNLGQNGSFINHVSLFFDEKFAGLQMEDIHETNTWPLLSSTAKTYLAYGEKQDVLFLEELSSLEILSLYLYAIEREEEKIVEAMSVAELDYNQSEVNAMDLAFQTGVIIRVDHANHQETYQFVRWEDNKILAEVELINEDKTWKVANVEIYD